MRASVDIFWQPHHRCDAGPCAESGKKEPYRKPNSSSHSMLDRTKLIHGATLSTYLKLARQTSKLPLSTLSKGGVATSCSRLNLVFLVGKGLMIDKMRL